MRKLFFYGRFFLCIFACMALLQSCLKDSASKTYTMFTPVYKDVAEVRAAIKNDAPVPVVKPGKIFVQGNYIFLNEIDKGIHVIDNTNPAAPINKYFIAIPGNLDLAVKGNTLYADLYRDLVTIDISDPSAVKVKKITEKVFSERQYATWYARDTTKVVVDWIKKDTTMSLDPETAWPGRRDILFMNDMQLSYSSSSARAKGISGSMARFTLLNNYLYTVTQSNLNTFNISQPENPVFANSQSIGWNIETIFPFKGNLFIGSQTGMFIYGTANPAQPSQLSQFMHITSCDPVIADDNYAYVTLRTGNTCNGVVNQLDILDISNLSYPSAVKSYALTNPHGLSKSGNTLFICDGEAGLKVYDASHVKSLQHLQTVEGINAYDVIAQNDLVIVVAADGLYQYKNSNNTLVFRSRLSYKSF